MLLMISFLFQKQKNINARLFIIILLPLSYLLSTLINGGSLDALGKYLAFLFTPFIFSVNLSLDMKNKIFKAFVFSTLFFLTIALMLVIREIIISESLTVIYHGLEHYKFTGHLLTQTFNNWHPTYLSMFCNFSIALLSYIELKRTYKIILYSLLIIFIFMLNSLTGIICLFILTSFITFNILKNNKKILVLTSIILIALIGLTYLNPMKFGKIEQIKNREITITDKSSKSNSLNIRLVKWLTSLKVFKENKIFGVSPSLVKEKMNLKYKENGYETAAKNKYGPHNQFLFILVASGVLGFSIFIVLMVLPLLNGFKKITSYFFLTTFIFFFTEDILERQQGIMYFAVFYVLISKISNNKKTNNNESIFLPK